MDKPIPESSPTSTRLASRASAVAALRHRDFRVVFAGTFLSNSGSWMQKVATSWLVYTLTGSSAWLGAEAFVSGMSTVVLLPIGGVIADRVDRRRLLIVTNILCALSAFALAVLAATSCLRLWHILMVSGFTGCLLAVMVPASTSLLPALVGSEGVPNAISLNSLQFNIARALGPLAGGLALAHLGAAWCFALNGVSFLALVCSFLIVRRLPAVATTNESLYLRLINGIKYVRRQPGILKGMALVLAAATLGAPVVSLLPALTAQVLQRSAASYSALVTCFAIGAIGAGAAHATLARRLSGDKVLAVQLIVVGLSEIALPYCKVWGIAAVLVACAGFGFIGAMIQLGTSILQQSEDEYRGRVTSLQQVSFRAGQPAGALAGGLVGGLYGITPVFWLSGASLIVVTCGVIAWRPPYRAVRL